MQAIVSNCVAEVAGTHRADFINLCLQWVVAGDIVLSIYIGKNTENITELFVCPCGNTSVKVAHGSNIQSDSVLSLRI